MMTRRTVRRGSQRARPGHVPPRHPRRLRPDVRRVDHGHGRRDVRGVHLLRVRPAGPEHPRRDRSGRVDLRLRPDRAGAPGAIRVPEPRGGDLRTCPRSIWRRRSPARTGRSGRTTASTSRASCAPPWRTSRPARSCRAPRRSPSRSSTTRASSGGGHDDAGRPERDRGSQRRRGRSGRAGHRGVDARRRPMSASRRSRTTRPTSRTRSARTSSPCR